MNVWVSVMLISLLNSALAFFVGRTMRHLGALQAVVAFTAISIGIALLLTFGAIFVLAEGCRLLGFMPTQCVDTDQNTVWLLLVPMILFPVYTVCMFIGRASDANAA